MPLITAPARNVNPRHCIYRIDRHAADSGTNKESKSTQLYLLDRVGIICNKALSGQTLGFAT